MNTNEEIDTNENIILEKEQIFPISKKYSINEILKSPYCPLSKEKIFLWKNSLFSKKFYEILTSNNDSEISGKYNDIYPLIENILMGDFGYSTEKRNYYKDFYYLSYILTPKNSFNKNYILFVIYYSKLTEESNYFVEYLEFLEISDIKNDIKIAINNFNYEKKYSNNELEFDKQCFLDSNIFFSEIIKGNDDIIIRYPNENEIINKSDKIKKIEYLGEKTEDKGFVDIERLKHKSYIFENVLNLLREKNILNYDLFFNKKIINFIPSKTEKNLIDKNSNFILSGRPGTGKTFIILIKAVLTYLNCWAEHSKLEKNLIDWDYIHNKYLIHDKNNIIDDNYKIIVTSLSQVLCLKAEELFSQCMRSLEYNKEYKASSINQIENLESFQNIKKYPMFINFRKIIFLIDGSLNFQFFDRPTNNKINKIDNQCDIKFIPNLSYDINYKINIDDIGILNYFYRSQYGETHKAIEINEDTFYIQFNQEISKNKILNNKSKKIEITTLEVYSQIISIIKGSSSSYLSLSNSLTRSQYKVLGKKLTMFTEEQKDEIYDFYIKYEKWKVENNYFDFQDVVNYLIRQVSIELVPKNVKLIDILFIDEVQDFSINQLYLMSLIARDIKVLAGDTCQTISKTNSFRFCDLNSIYYISKEINMITQNKKALDIPVPEEIQTNLNFRCHFPILKLAHLIYEMIFLLFPQTLDKIKCDFTKDITGYKPTIITNIEDFIKKLTGNDEKESDKKDKINKREFTFAFNHCFICRNSEAEKKLSEKYNKKILVSTVRDSKGMEYEIVIIYNFFKDALPFVLNLWSKVLNHMKFSVIQNPNIGYIKKELEYEEIPKKIMDEVLLNFKDKISITYTDILDENMKHKLYNMCAELKELYVAITRAKTSLFFYDEDMDVFPSFIKILRNFNLINKNEDQDKAIKYAIDYLKEHLLEENELRNIAEDNLKMGNYKKAEFYFNILKDEKMSKKAFLFYKFEEIQKKKNFKKEDKKTIEYTKYIDSNKELLTIIKDYKIPLDDSNIEGEIYINLEDYEKALTFFKNKKNKKKCGLIYQMTGKYKEGFKCFDSIKEYGLAIECLIGDKDYKKLFKYIISNQNVFNLEHFSEYYKTYASKFIETLNINLTQKDEFIFNNQKLKDIPLIYTTKQIKIINYKSNYGDDGITNKIENYIAQLFPKIKKYEKKMYLGLNFFKEKHTFDQPSQRKYIKYLVNDNIQNELFIKTEENNISKNINEIFSVFDKYVTLFDFYFDFLNFRKNNLDEETIKYIDYKKDELKQLKQIKYDYQQNNETNKDKKNNKENKDNFEKLLKTKINNQELIQKLIKGWKLSQKSKDITETQLLKTNLVSYFIKSFPLLFLHKSNELELKNKNNNCTKQILLSKTLEEIVQVCKALPLTDNELIKSLESCMILSGHFRVIFPFLSNRNLFLFSALFKKNKIFIKFLIDQKISFIPERLQCGIFTGQDNFYFIFNSFLRLYLCKYFDYRAKAEIDKTGNRIFMYNKIIREILSNLKEYPKIYSLLYKFENSFQALSKVNEIPLEQIKVPFPISQYLGIFGKFLSDYNKDYTEKELIQLIEIGNTISLYITINGLSTTSLTKNIINNNSEINFKIVRLLIKLKELLLVYKPREYKFLVVIFSLFSALGISLFPEMDELKIFECFPCCVINNSSILYWSSEKYFDYLNLLNKISLFDSTTKNKLIFYNTVYKVFNEITHRAIIKIFHNENPFYSTPAYNYLITENLKKYFDSLLYNYSFHRRKYLNEICDIKPNNDNDDDLIEEIFSTMNTNEANYLSFNFGFYENFCRTLCDWPKEDEKMELLDTIFCPFYRWDRKIKNDGSLNFTQIAIILGELPMIYETLPEFDIKEYKKYMSLIFDINENLFNEILYLYVKKRNSRIQKNELNDLYSTKLGRIFINYILFSLLINKYQGYKFDDFKEQKIINVNLLNKDDNYQEVNELFKFIGYESVEKYEQAQKVFPYKIVLELFKTNEIKITKLLKLIWLKKLYPLVVYSMKKSEKLKLIENYLPIYGINMETIDFRYFNYNKIQLTEDEINLYFKILYNFMSNELSITKAESKFFKEVTEKSQNKDKYLYRPYFQNYIELQIYMIIISISKISSILNSYSPYLKEKTTENEIYKNILDIINIYDSNSFYKKKGLDIYDISNIDRYIFNFFIINEKNKLDKSYIKIYELTIREINVTSKYAVKDIELKNIMNKNLMNKKYLFINNKTIRQEKVLKEKKPNYIKDLIRFLFVPLKKETQSQYLKTAQIIYNDFFDTKIKTNKN
jgi:hypothetical protein